MVDAGADVIVADAVSVAVFVERVDPPVAVPRELDACLAAGGDGPLPDLAKHRHRLDRRGADGGMAAIGAECGDSDEEDEADDAEGGDDLEQGVAVFVAHGAPFRTKG